MADIELVIKISEELYEANIRGLEAGEVWDLRVAVKNGTPLPKGHGGLIDVDAISLADINFFSIGDYRKMVRKLTDAPTIIEADSEYEIWEGMHSQVIAPKGTFDRIFNEAKEEDDGI